MWALLTFSRAMIHFAHTLVAFTTRMGGPAMTGERDETVQISPIGLKGFLKCFLLKGRQAVLVDTGSTGDGRRIRDALPHYGVRLTDLALIVITHAHPGHAGGLAYLKERLNVPVAVHRLDADALRQGFNRPFSPAGKLGGLLCPLFPRGVGYAGVEPDILIEDEFDLSPYGVAGKVISTPGHTPGSLSVILDGGQAIVGDLVVGGLIRRRKPSISAFADDENQVLASIQKMLDQSVNVVYSTHGGPFSADAVRRQLLDQAVGERER
jgi:hydroxyacylglutathione hydrolase